MTAPSSGPKVYDAAMCCDAPHIAKGLCTTCYQRFKRHKKTGTASNNMERILSIVDAHEARKAAARHERAARKKIRRRDRDGGSDGYWRDSTLRRRYGIGADGYSQLLEQQGGGCAICKEPPGDKAFYVDHCHVTGAVRGVLCPRCNTLVGFIETAGDLFGVAAEYIKQRGSGTDDRP